MKDLWRERSVGIKLWGFDGDPYELSKSINALTDSVAIGEPHGLKNTYKENQMHILKIINKDEYWGDSLSTLINEIGNIEGLLSIIKKVEPKKYFIVINKPLTDLKYGHSNDLSKECIAVLSKMDCDVSFNFF